MNQEELDKKLQLLYVIDREEKDALIKNKSELDSDYRSFAEKIYSKSNEEILSDIEKRISELTTKFIYQVFEYKSELCSSDNCERYASQLELLEESLLEFSDDFEEIEQHLQICRLFKRIGININLIQAYYIWEYVSDAACAQWLGKEEDNITWWKILTDWVYNQKEELK